MSVTWSNSCRQSNRCTAAYVSGQVVNSAYERPKSTALTTLLCVWRFDPNPADIQTRMQVSSPRIDAKACHAHVARVCHASSCWGTLLFFTSRCGVTSTSRSLVARLKYHLDTTDTRQQHASVCLSVRLSKGAGILGRFWYLSLTDKHIVLLYDLFIYTINIIKICSTTANGGSLGSLVDEERS